MSNKQLKILVGALIVLLAAWGIARLVSGGGGPAAAQFDLEAGAAGGIDSVIISTADATVTLRADDGWTVNGHEAVPEAGESLKRAFEQAEVGPLVSRNTENHDRLGVTDAKGRRLIVYAGGAERISVLIGGRIGLGEAYVRRVGDDEVYTLSGTLVSLARRDVDAWRDREILTADRDAIQRIEYSYPDQSFSLVRDSTGWTIQPSGVAVEPAGVTALLSQIANLRAIGFADDSVVDTLTWEPTTAQVRVVGPDETALAELYFLERPDEVGYYVRRAGSPVAYTLNSYSGDQILKREGDLVPGDEDDTSEEQAAG